MHSRANCKNHYIIKLWNGTVVTVPLKAKEPSQLPTQKKLLSISQMMLEPPFDCVRTTVLWEPKNSCMEEFCGLMKLDLASLALGKPLCQ